MSERGQWDRFQRALAIYIDWSQMCPRPDAQQLIQEHEELREMLVDLLEADEQEVPQPYSTADSTGDPRRFQWRPRGFHRHARVGPFTVEEEIGVGGTSVVYKARQDTGESQRSVALKALHRRFVGPRDAVRFQRESRHLSKLQHPGIATLYTADVTPDGGGYLAMELVPHARSLLDYCRERRLTLRQRIELLVQVCEAVHHAHENRVLHRDLKPANILIGIYGEAARVKLIDFGFALDTDVPDDARLTLTWQVFGTPEYMSPEQLLGLPVDARSDQYSLGVVAYEVLGGQLPRTIDSSAFSGYAALCRAVRESHPATLSQAVADPVARKEKARERKTSPLRLSRVLRGDLGRIIGCALREDPSQRYPSVAHLGSDLHRYLEGLPLTVRSPSPGYLVRKAARRNPVATVLLAVLCMLLVGTAAGGLWFTQHLSRTYEELQQTSYRQRVSSAKYFLNSGLHRKAESLLEPVPELPAWEWKHIRREVNGDLLTVELERPLEQLTYSEDGHQLLGTSGAKIHEWDLSTGEELHQQTVIGIRPGGLAVTALLATDPRREYAVALARDTSNQSSVILTSLSNERDVEVLGSVNRFARVRASLTRDGAVAWTERRTTRRAKHTASVWLPNGRATDPWRTSGPLAVDSQTGRPYRPSDAQPTLWTNASAANSRDSHEWLVVADPYAAVWDDERVKVLALAKSSDPILDFKGVATSCAFSLAHKLIAVGFADGRVRIWHLGESAELQREILAHEGAVHGLTFHPWLPRVASHGDDKRLRVWHSFDRFAIVERSVINGFDLDRSGERLALIGGATVRAGLLYDSVLAEHLGLPALEDCDFVPSAVDFDPQGEQLALGTSTGGIVVSQVCHGSSPLILNRLRDCGPVIGVCFDSRGERLVATQCRVVDGRATASVWNIRTGQLVSKREFPNSAKFLARYAIDAELLLVAIARQAWVYDADMAGEPAVVQTHNGIAALSPDGKSLAIAAADGTLSLIQTSDPETRRSSPPLFAEIDAVAWSADARRLAVAHDNRLLLVDTRTLLEIMELAVPVSETIREVQFHAERSWLVCRTRSDESSWIRRWNAARPVEEAAWIDELIDRVQVATLRAESEYSDGANPGTERERWIRDTVESLRRAARQD